MSHLRHHAEHQFAAELKAPAPADSQPRPPSWNVSPVAVATYLLNGTPDEGPVFTPKWW
jgi:hypothetical protein